MRRGQAAPQNIDDYISAFSPDIRAILKKIRQIVLKNAPGAEEIISYRMPAFRMNAILLYFAAFKNHIGLYPPVSGNAGLEKALARFAGPKGNLKFPLDQPVPFGLIQRIVKLRVKQDLTKAAARKKK